MLIGQSVRVYFIVFTCIFTLLVPTDIIASNKFVNVYVDTDMTGSKESSNSIIRGISVALEETNNMVHSYTVNLLVRNHRGNTRRSKAHIEEYLNDKHGLVMFSGLHSPPLLANRDYINTNKVLFLVPWAAAGPITRTELKNNFIFRLSIDDSNAGSFIVKSSIDNEGFRSPYLLLEDTGWGKSNYQTMSNSLEQYNIASFNTHWFNWNIGLNEAKMILRKISLSGADVIFLVANATEGKVFAKAMASLPENERVAIRSHWGITGGDFPSVIDHNTRKKLDLQFIQTNFSILSPLNPFGKNVLDQTLSLFSDISSPADIQAPTGFIHAYDLTRILIAAIKQAGLSGDMAIDRINIKDALENLREPVEGLLKVYKTPYRVYTKSDPSAHEALGIDNYSMAKYGKNNEIILMGD